MGDFLVEIRIPLRQLSKTSIRSEDFIQNKK